MNEEQALKELSLDKLIEHCKKQCKLYRGQKRGYEHYIFLRLLKNSCFDYIDDAIIDYYLMCNGELKEDL